MSMPFHPKERANEQFKHNLLDKSRIKTFNFEEILVNIRCTQKFLEV